MHRQNQEKYLVISGRGSNLNNWLNTLRACDRHDDVAALLQQVLTLALINDRMRFRLYSLFMLTAGVAVISYAFSINKAMGAVTATSLLSFSGAAIGHKHIIRSMTYSAIGALVGIWTTLLCTTDMGDKSNYLAYAKLTFDGILIGLCVAFMIWVAKRIRSSIV